MKIRELFESKKDKVIARKTAKIKNDINYEEMLESLVDEAVDMSQFADILNRQEKEKTQAAPTKKSTIEIPFNNYIIRYRPKTKQSDMVPWLILDKSGDKVHSGQSGTEKDAVNDGENWIKRRGTSDTQKSTNSTIDFNVEFSQQIIGGPEEFFAMISYGDDTPVLYVSSEPQKGLKRSHLGRSKSGDKTQLQTITLSPKESNEAKLVPGGRYTLGNQLEGWGEDLKVFELTMNSITQGSTDKQRLRVPGLTVAR